MKRNLLLFGLLTVVVILFSSCRARHKFVYLNDMSPEVEYIVNNKPEAIIQKDDRLSIVVNSKSPELAVPFNLHAANVGTINVNNSGEVLSDNTTVERERGYLVDGDGNIDFPVLGILHVQGMTTKQLTDMIKERIMQGGYIKDPIVQVDFTNFKYYTLGAIRPGVHRVEGGRINLIEAIARGGDLDNRAMLDRITVIRDNGEHRKVYVTDIRSKDIFDSPAFYLQQNDIVYVEPRYRKREAEQSVMYYMSLITAPITAALAFIAVFK